MIAQGAAPQRSAFLSAFFALVGLHGLHVTVGLLWLGTMMAQVWVKGLRPDILRRLLCFSLFWHALDIVWVGIFTVVYLWESPHELCRREPDAATADTAPGDETTRMKRDRGRAPQLCASARAVDPAHGRLVLLAAVPRLVWGPGIPVALVVFAIAQMGVHLVFFLHITTAPDNTNNVLALAFGVLIVSLLIAGSLWIMANLNSMMPMAEMMRMQR